jgi:hypothetical protein
MSPEPLRLPLLATPEQASRLGDLQRSFAQVCNQLAPVVQQRRLWNRVTLHHLMYRGLRDEFPALGSQMVCNAIHAVCRSARLVYQSPASPFRPAVLQGAPLPLLRFSDNSPVFFDRHTLSLRAGVVSIYTLEGRIHCPVLVAPADEARFHQERLRDLMLQRAADGGFALAVSFVATPEAAGEPLPPAAAPLFPEYLQIGTCA